MVKDAQQKSKQIGRASAPRLKIDIELVPGTVGRIADVSHPLLPIFIGLSHHVGEVGRTREKNSQECSEPAFTIDGQDDHAKYEQLHIILQIPAPLHTHGLPVVYEIVHVDQRPPQIRAHLGKRHDTMEEWPASHVGAQSVVNHDGDKVGG